MGRLIRQGDQGHDVRAVQDVLNFHIRRLAPLKVDGIFGPLTHGRTMEFQRINQLKADGIVGPNTMGKLFLEMEQPVGIALTPRDPAPASSASSARSSSASALSLRGASAPVPLGQRTPSIGIQPPRLISPLTLPPIRVPFFLPPVSIFPVPPLAPTGQTVDFLLKAPVQSDPLDPFTATSQEFVKLLDHLPQNFPFRASIIGAVPRPKYKVGVLELDPASPMSFGFRWGVSPLFDLKSVGPPPAFAVGASLNAACTIKVIDNSRLAIPQLGIFINADFKATIDWTSNLAQSRPLVDMKGNFGIGFKGTF